MRNLGKAEFMNPGGSVKDRAAKWIVLDAERRGALKPGGTVVEGTAGNTGIGLAHVCNARGYKCVIVMPDNQAAEKYQIIEALGAELRKVPAVPYSNPNQYQKVAGRLSQELPDAVWANQFDNTANREAHFESTGPGNLARHGRKDRRLLRRHRHRRHAGGHGPIFEDPNTPQCALCSSIRRAAPCITTFKDGELKSDGGSSITEGIGTGRVTANLEGAPIDDALRISDARDDALRLSAAARGGLAARQYRGHQRRGRRDARETNRSGHTIVTVLCDGGAKYQSRLFNRRGSPSGASATRSPDHLRGRVRFTPTAKPRAARAALNQASDACRDTTSPTTINAGDCKSAWAASGRDRRQRAGDDALILQALPGR